MFANCQLMGMDLAFPDICKTPPVMVPIPYPNVALGPMAIPNAWNVLILGMPAHNLLTTIPLSNGDNPGLGMGLISQTVMSQARPITCVPNVLFGCIPATRLTGLSTQNTINTVGMRVVPSQPTVVLLGAGGGGGGGAAAEGAAAEGEAAVAAEAEAAGAEAEAGAAESESAAAESESAAPEQAAKTPRAKSARERNMGRTPGKSSKTGREVQQRMEEEGRLRENPMTGEKEFEHDGDWYPVKEADMGHKTDAVKWWNETGRQYGEKAPEVRKWMLDSKNYELEPSSINRSNGAKLGQTYLPALK